MEQGTPTPLAGPGGVEGVSAGLGPDASWRWPEERWRRAVNKVRAGRPCDRPPGRREPRWLWHYRLMWIRKP